MKLPESKIDRSRYYGTEEKQDEYRALRDAELDAAGIELPQEPAADLIPEGWRIDCTAAYARRNNGWIITDGIKCKMLGHETSTSKLTGWTRHDERDAWGNTDTWWSRTMMRTGEGHYDLTSAVERTEIEPPTYQQSLMATFPARFASLPWTGVDETGDRALAVKTCKRWAAAIVDGKKQSVWLTGKPGRGKTQMSYWIMLELAAHEIVVERHDMADIVRDLRMTYNSESKEHKREKFEQTMLRAERAKVLILDDVGAEMGGDDVRAVLHRLVDYRWENNLPTLVTSNFTPEQLGAESMNNKRLDARIVSRFSSYFTVTVGGPDFRQGA